MPATKALLRVLLAEAIGTGFIVLFGCGSVCASLSGAYSGIFQVASVWGLGVALAIYTTCSVSGAHLNPAISVAFLLVRPEAYDAFDVAKLGRGPMCALYQVAQLAGAIAAGGINLFVHGPTIRAFERGQGITRGDDRSVLSASAFGEYFPNPGLKDGGFYTDDDVSTVHALFTEAWGTFILAFVVFSLTHAKKSGLGEYLGALAPALIGSTVAVLLALYAPITQAGWNPARDFGPRVVAAAAGWGEVAILGPRSGFWVYILGPYLGAPLGAALAELVLLGDDPAEAAGATEKANGHAAEKAENGF